jgi:hypothetical protein
LSAGFVPCTVASLAAAEELVGSATQTERWLLLETRERWRRDVAEHDPPGFEGRVLLIRGAGSTAEQPTIYVANGAETGGMLTRLHSLDDLATGKRVDHPLVLVCTHGRRDPCCARHGTGVYRALRSRLGPARAWQSSHQGGHRFAANVLVLPWGVQLGRVTVPDVDRVVELVETGRLPLDLYRGRTFYAPATQAAEVALRRRLGADRLADLGLVRETSGTVVFAHLGGEVSARVVEREGPLLPMSCGAEPKPTVRFDVSF